MSLFHLQQKLFKEARSACGLKNLLCESFQNFAYHNIHGILGIFIFKKKNIPHRNCSEMG